MKWVTSVLDPSVQLPKSVRPLLRVDGLTKRNVDLLKRFRDGIPASDIPWKYKPASKMHILGDIARFRLWSQPEIALDKLEAWVKKNDIDMDDWPHGQTARALLYIDRGMKASAINIVEKAMKKHPRHPHLRRLAIYLATKGELELPESEKTGLIWADTMEGDWEKNWQSSHNVVAAPDNRTSMMKIHSWFANAWLTRRETTTKRLGKKGWKKAAWPNPPFANHLIMTGIITTVGGVPVDLGMPGWIDFDACEKAGLFDL